MPPTLSSADDERRDLELAARAERGAPAEDPALLWELVHAGCPALLRGWLARGADVHARDARTGQLPIHSAAGRPAGSREPLETLRVLLDGGARVDARTTGAMAGLTPLHFASHEEDPERLGLLLQRGADVNARDAGGRTPLSSAAFSGRDANAALLLDAGADPDPPDEHGNRPLAVALSQASRPGGDRVALVRRLLAAGAAPEQRYFGKTTLELAAKHAPQILPELVLAGATVVSSAPDVPSLVAALVRRGAGDELASLLSRGVSVETVDPAGRTPLHLAAEDGWPELVDLLLGRGASITSRTRDGQLPLHGAVGSRAERATTALLGAGAPVDAVDGAGRTALHVACGRGFGGCVRRLLAAGAAVDAVDAAGATPLHHAAAGRADAVVDLLLAAGADPSQPDRFGHRPGDYASASLGKRLGQTQPAKPPAQLASPRASRVHPMEKPHRSLTRLGEPDCVYALLLPAKRYTEVPGEVTRCPNLRWLDLSDNRIQSLPPALAGLRLLEELDLSGNRLATLEHLPVDLRALWVADNPLAPDVIGALRAARPGLRVIA